MTSLSERKVEKVEEKIAFRDFPELPGLWTSENKVLVLSATECEKVFPMSIAVRSQREAFIDGTNGIATAPSRLILKIPGLYAADTLFKPSISQTHLAVKVVSVRPNNPKNYKLPSLTGAILLFDKNTGSPKCFLDAQFVTGRRTAAGSGVATDFCCKADPTELCVFGAGTQAREHIRAMLTVRPSITVVWILSRTFRKAELLAAQFALVLPNVKFEAIALKRADEIVARADIICTTTFSTKPLFNGSKVKRGAHLNCVGAYTAEMREIDTATLKRSLVFIDSGKALQCGDFAQPIKAGEWTDLDCANVLGAWISKDLGRTDKELTLFNSVGLGTQDLYAVVEIYKRALSASVGTMISL